MKYFYFSFLIIGTLLFFEVKCKDPMMIVNGDARDLAEGYSYERFNFLTELNVDGRKVNKTFYWNSCSNYTGINYFLNKTGSEDCFGQVINCAVINNNRMLSKRDVTSVKLNRFTLNKLSEFIHSYTSCHCLCNRLYDEPPDSYQPDLLDSICLDEVSADVKNNYVLTGVRLHRLNNTITFEVQEGQFTGGIIRTNTLRWVPPPKKCNKIGLMTFTKRTLVLDDVIFSGDIVVTGVAFKRYSDVPQNERIHPESADVLEKDPFFLSVIGHKLSQNNSDVLDDFKISISVWDYSLENRTNLINSDMDLPIALMLPFHNHILSKPKENYVTFDLAIPQEGLRKFVIPYVDSQNLTDSTYPQFVKGIGLFYKGYEGYGGYVAPSIFVPAY